MMFCRHCGNRLPEYARFCNKCGAPQIAPAQRQQGMSPLVVRSSGPTNNPEKYPASSFAAAAPPPQAPGISAAPYPAPPFPDVPRRSR
ncbi:MAG: zinc ribbon domain-containing protein [Ktedonobacteraceae bacterium]